MPDLLLLERGRAGQPTLQRRPQPPLEQQAARRLQQQSREGPQVQLQVRHACQLNRRVAHLERQQQESPVARHLELTLRQGPGVPQQAQLPALMLQLSLVPAQ
jgi:hypothetical protein